MKVTMDDSRITSIAQLKEFLKGSEKIVVSLEDGKLSEKYQFIEKTIKKFSILAKFCLGNFAVELFFLPSEDRK